MKQALFATTIVLTATLGSMLGAAAPAARAFEGTQSLAANKTASETPYEATDPRYQTEESKTKVTKVEEEVSQNKGHRRGFRRRSFRRRGFGRRGFSRRGFGRRRFGHRH